MTNNAQLFIQFIIPMHITIATASAQSINSNNITISVDTTLTTVETVNFGVIGGCGGTLSVSPSSIVCDCVIGLSSAMPAGMLLTLVPQRLFLFRYHWMLLSYALYLHHRLIHSCHIDHDGILFHTIALIIYNSMALIGTNRLVRQATLSINTTAVI